MTEMQMEQENSMDSEVEQNAKSRKEIKADIITIIEEALNAKGFHLIKTFNGEHSTLWDIFDDENNDYYGVVAL